MKKFICIVASLLYVVFWFYIGTTFFPFMAWLLDTKVPIIPLVLVFLIVAGCVIDSFISAFSKKREKKWLIEKIPPVVWLPPMVCLLICTFYLGQRYDDDTYNRYGRINTHHVGWWSGRKGLANKWGNDILRFDCYWIQDCGDYAKVHYVDKDSEIIPLTDKLNKHTLVPKEFITEKNDKINQYEVVDSLSTRFRLIKDGDRRGVIDTDGNIILPPIYDGIRVCHGYFELKSGKFSKTGLANFDGKVVIPCNYRYNNIIANNEKFAIVEVDNEYGGGLNLYSIEKQREIVEGVGIFFYYHDVIYAYRGCTWVDGSVYIHEYDIYDLEGNYLRSENYSSDSSEDEKLRRFGSIDHL